VEIYGGLRQAPIRDQAAVPTTRTTLPAAFLAILATWIAGLHALTNAARCASEQEVAPSNRAEPVPERSPA
jgi:hypothetical protein